MTRNEVRTLVRKRLGETTSAFWTDSELNTWIDDAGHEISYAAKCIRDTTTFESIEDVSEYTLSTIDSRLISITEVRFYQDGSTWEKLTATSRDELDTEQPGWLNADSGTPDRYYYDIEEDMLYLYVAPDEDNAGADYCKLWYAKDWADITSDDAEITQIPLYLHQAIVYHVVATGLGTRGYGDKENMFTGKFNDRISSYLIERGREKEDEDIIMVPRR